MNTMSQIIHAIYEGGVLKPLDPLHLAEHQRVRVSVATELSDLSEIGAAQRRAMLELDAEMDSLPDGSPADSFTAADHDKLLYGGSP